jgi:hypothetical protein
MAFFRYFNPFGFLAMFYTLFYIIPQVMGIFTGYDIIGYPPISEDTMYQIFVQGQFFLVLFLFMIALGAAAVSVPFLRRPRFEFEAIFPKKFSLIENSYLWACFFLGFIGLAYLAKSSFSLTGFRSELVKSVPGALATAVSFFTNFAFALITYQLVVNKRIVRATVLLIVFGGAIMLTGARGRLLWPLAITAFLIIGHRNQLNVVRSVLVAAFLVVILSILDPLRAMALSGKFEAIDIGGSVAKLFISRNFDGFANFSLIVDYDLIVPNITYLFEGSRDVFMYTYFYDVYTSGVAFGSTFPGWLYISGGTVGLLFLSILYGAVLAAVGVAIRKTRSPYLITSYMFMAIWFTAVGGDAVESINKMVVAGLPGLIAALLIKQRHTPKPGVWLPKVAVER